MYSNGFIAMDPGRGYVWVILLDGEVIYEGVCRADCQRNMPDDKGAEICKIHDADLTAWKDRSESCTMPN